MLSPTLLASRNNSTNSELLDVTVPFLVSSAGTCCIPDSLVTNSF